MDGEQVRSEPDHADVARAGQLEPLQTSRLIDILDQQLSVLRRIDQRQAAADLSQQPIPEVPATNSSAWNALLGSTLTDTIEPRVERWRSGLDALLVFLGLFSAIVTAFLVNSLAGLTEDKVAKTNELLVNLTEIVIALSGKPASGLNISHPAPFRPDASDVRVNAFWSLSLTFSLSIAALAVGCRGFLNMITWSRHKKASERLADVWTRWNAADRVLRPAIEALGQLLVIPVFLFIIGILDTLFSSVQELLHPPPFILFSFGVSLLCITAVAALLCFTVVDGTIHPMSSPFQSRLAYNFRISLLPRVDTCASWIRRHLGPPHLAPSASRLEASAPQADTSRLATSTIDLYHQIVQLTHEDESLDQAAGALFNVIHERAGTPSHGWVRISSQECATLRHLLSPEASIRSNRTAAWVIVRIQKVNPRRTITYSPEDFGSVLASLTGAAKRAGGGYSLGALWDSLFIRAMGVMLLDEDKDPNEHPLILRCLSSAHSTWDKSLFDPSTATRSSQSVLAFLLDVLYAKLHEELPALVNKSEARIVDLLLSPKFSLSAVPISIDSRSFMQSLIFRPPGENRRELAHIIRWIMKVTHPSHVIVHYLQNLEGISAAQVKSLSWAQCGSLFAIIDTVARLCLDAEDFEDWELLSELCATCLIKFITARDRLNIAAFSFDLVLTLLHVMRSVRPNTASVTIQHLRTIYRYVHDTPHSRYSEVLLEFQALLGTEHNFQETVPSVQDEDYTNLSWAINDDAALDFGDSDLGSGR
ncbi:hypothetical protein DFH09DRAFT_1140075 [Mycena vulgaris]|nr:hypothetical protein DFH09DRAFT_1140075 [Mycena vulgaris]